MSPKTLLVNPFDFWHPHVPMGLFGLCDYLRQRGLEARLFNASLYAHDEHVERLCATIAQTRPEHVGVVLHWKELILSALYLSWVIKQRHPKITVFLGGFTAGYFGRELLQRWPHLDGVIRGDGEMALEHLLSGRPMTTAPGAFYRDGQNIHANPSASVGEDVLDTISYSDLTFLQDHERQVERITVGNGTGFPPLGVPLFIGKGCTFDCGFCGGSKTAYREHSGRSRVGRRSVEAILRDLRRLTVHTDYIYLCHETSKAHIYQLFGAIAADRELAGRYACSYGTWSVMDTRLLDLYCAAFRLGGNRVPIIEMSPETANERDRARVRDKAVSFPNAALLGSLRATTGKLGANARIELYFSRFHPMQTQRKLLQELAQIHDLRASIFSLGLERVIGVKYVPLATDPGSRYWDLAAAGASRNEMIDRLLESHKEFLLPTFRTDPGVMSLYRPPRLSAAFALVFSSVVRFIDMLSRLQFGYYFHATRLVGFDAIWRVLRALAERGIAGDAAMSGLLAGMRTLLSAQRDATLLLALVHHELMRRHGKKLARYRH